MNDNTEIQHDEQEKRFYIDLVGDNQAVAVLDYHLLAGNRIDFHHTYVPDVYRGKGLAGLLVKDGFEWAKQQGLTLDSTCSYALKKQKQLAI